MSSDAEDYVVRVLEEEPLPVVMGSDSGGGGVSDASKWAAVHNVHEPSALRQTANSPGSLFTAAWVLGITLGLIWVFRNGRTVFEQWQENTHRRANRRRHGIPDDDDRPFNVAYAAASLARRERQEQQKNHLKRARRGSFQSVPEHSDHGVTVDLRQHNTQPSVSIPTLFENKQPAFLQGSSTRPMGNNESHFSPQESSTHRAQFRPQQSTDHPAAQSYDRSGRYNANRQADGTDLSQPLQRSSSGDRGSRRRPLEVNDAESAPAERRKFDEMDGADSETRSTKKSKVAVDKNIDDNDAVWENMPGGSRRGSLQVLKRGSKRHANEEADDDWEMSQDKRARKSSGPKVSGEDADSDVDMVHDSDRETGLSRGTKRVRDDAESVADSAPQSSDASPSMKPARKRRAHREDEPEPVSRGRKRHRSQQRASSSDDEDEEGETSAPRHKRGRQGKDDDEEDSDIVPDDASLSESEAEVSSDPACGGRRLGETWEVNGQSFKVGLDGRRLRHALVKQSRTKFPMPKDSAHKDAVTNVDVVVEKWLNDDEYKTAKERFELAWQDASPVSTPEKAPNSARWEEPAYSGGKRLLWNGPPPSPVKGRVSMHGVPGVQNPFDLAPSNSGRRVTSAQILLNNKTESPKLRNSKSFSKWEKQDLEASSLKKMRARMEKQKVEAADVAKSPVAAPTPLAATTNTQSQPPLPTPDLQKPTLPQSNVQPATPAVNPFTKPEGSTPATSSTNIHEKRANVPHAAQKPSFSFEKPGITSSSGGAQPASAIALHTPPQGLTSSPATVQTAIKPTFTFGAVPTQSNSPKPSTFRFGQPGAAPSSSTPNAPPAASKPLSFGPAPAESRLSNATGPGSTPSSEPSKSGIPNFFANPAPQSAPPSAAPASSTPNNTGAFNFSGNQTAQSNPPAKPTFQFGQSGGQTSTPPAKSAFQFGQPGGQTTSGTPSGGTPSLLNRLAPPPQGSSQSTQTSAPQNAFSAIAGGSATPSPFGKPNSTTPSNNLFGKQPQPQSSQANLFGQKLEQRQDQQQDSSKQTLFTTGLTAGSEAPKISPFGAPSLAAGSAASPFAFPKPPGQSDATTRPAIPSFSFQPAQPGQQQQPTQSKPSFSFNFGGTNTTNKSPQPPATQFGTSSASTSNATAAPAATPSTGFSFNFGNPTTPSNPSPFGGFGTKQAESDKK